MFQWLKRRMTPVSYQGHTANDWYSFFRSPQYFQGNLARAVNVALREALASENETLDLEIPPLLSVLLTTDSREEVRCLAAIKMGLDQRTDCETSLLAAL